MNGLKCSEEEARNILAYDKAVEKGEKTPHDLTPKQNKVAQGYTRTGTRKPTVYKFEKKDRKPNEPKRELIAVIAAALAQGANNLEVTNPERQIDFSYCGTRYRIVLSAPRK